MCCNADAILQQTNKFSGQLSEVHTNLCLWCNFKQNCQGKVRAVEKEKNLVTPPLECVAFSAEDVIFLGQLDGCCFL